MADDTKNTDSGTPQQPDAAPQPPATPPTDKMPQVKSDALKFAIIGFVIWIVLQFIFGMIVFGTISAAMYGLMNSVDMGSYNYGYHGSW